MNSGNPVSLFLHAGIALAIDLKSHRLSKALHELNYFVSMVGHMRSFLLSWIGRTDRRGDLAKICVATPA
jgi:hypothetical protein